AWLQYGCQVPAGAASVWLYVLCEGGRHWFRYVPGGPLTPITHCRKHLRRLRNYLEIGGTLEEWPRCLQLPSDWEASIKSKAPWWMVGKHLPKVLHNFSRVEQAVMWNRDLRRMVDEELKEEPKEEPKEERKKDEFRFERSDFLTALIKRELYRHLNPPPGI